MELFDRHGTVQYTAPDATTVAEILQHAIQNDHWIVGAYIKGEDLSQLDLTKLKLKDCHLQNCDLSGADLDAAELTRCEFETCILAGTNLGNARIRSTVFTGTPYRKESIEQTLMGATDTLSNDTAALITDFTLQNKVTQTNFIGTQMTTGTGENNCKFAVCELTDIRELTFNPS